MRLPVIAHADVLAEQKPLYDKLHDSIKRYLYDFTTHRPDGTLIGPFNALLHFPKLGDAAWNVFLALNDEPTLPPLAREVVILVTGAAAASIYELYSHEVVAARKGLSAAKIRTIAAGQRPPDLTEEEEALAYDVAAVLTRGAQVPMSTYEAAVARFGEKGVADIAYLVGCYGLICNLLNVFDVAVPATEGGLGANATLCGEKK